MTMEREYAMETTGTDSVDLGVTLRQWLRGRVAQYAQRPETEIRTNLPFAEYGLDSVAALSLFGDIEDRFGLYLEPTVAWDYPTVDALARHLVTEVENAGQGA
jgi:acyl carrier protein